MLIYDLGLRTKLLTIVNTLPHSLLYQKFTSDLFLRSPVLFEYNGMSCRKALLPHPSIYTYSALSPWCRRIGVRSLCSIKTKICGGPSSCPVGTPLVGRVI